jgi:hypothetical protein
LINNIFIFNLHSLRAPIKPTAHPAASHPKSGAAGFLGHHSMLD